MMQIPIYYLNAFTDKLFSGNPAAVCVLPKWLSDSTLQKIATENNLPATAFLVRENAKFHTRWFAPEYEIDLGGHSLVASAYVIFNKLEPHWKEVKLFHHTVGSLLIRRNNEDIILNFPVKTLEPVPASALLCAGLGKQPKEIFGYKNERLLAIYETEDEVKQLIPTMELLKQLPYRGIIVTAKGQTVDFVSRVFYPNKSLWEDQVTGSSYCLLAPYWQKHFNKTEFYAQQLSPRGGTTICHLQTDRVLLHARATLYQEGTFYLTE